MVWETRDSESRRQAAPISAPHSPFDYRDRDGA